jgi:hypothetical protein
MNDTVKWVLIGVGVYLIWEQFSQSDLASTVGTTTTAPTTGTTPTTTTTAPTTTTGATAANPTNGLSVDPRGGTTASSTPPGTTPVANVMLLSNPTLVANNALQAIFSINGVQETIAVIPNGNAYNTSGVGITSQLAAVGVTPAQLYAQMSAHYTDSQYVASSTANPGLRQNGPTGMRGLAALADGPTVNMRPAGNGKWVM